MTDPATTHPTESVWDYPRPPRLEPVAERIRVVIDGVTVADTTRAYRVLETSHPPSYYLPPEDVRTDLFTPSDTRSRCAYKGEASYWSLPDVEDVAWFYPAPLREAGEVKDRIAFFDEMVDVVVDGDRRERPVTPWSRP